MIIHATPAWSHRHSCLRPQDRDPRSPTFRDVDGGTINSRLDPTDAPPRHRLAHSNLNVM